MRGVGDAVQPWHLFHQHDLGLAPGDPMLPVVDLIHERVAGRLDRLERRVLGQQVCVFRNDVGLGDLHRGLHSALGCGVRGLAGQHGHAVVASEVHRLLIAHWNPGEVGGRDSFLVVGQHIGRGALKDPEGTIQRGENARRRPIEQRDHDPETRPGQPRDEQHRLLPADHRPVAEVVLQPHPRLGHPGPVDPDPADLERGLGPRDGAAAGAGLGRPCRGHPRRRRL